MKTKLIGYWIITAILAFALLSGGIGQLANHPETIRSLVQLGYPPYLATILGFWKVLGGIALLAPGLPRLKEWAYAGVFFNMTGAAASHVFSADAAWHIAVTVAFAVLTVASWALRPANRRLQSQSDETPQEILCSP